MLVGLQSVLFGYFYSDSLTKLETGFLVMWVAI